MEKFKEGSTGKGTSYTQSKIQISEPKFVKRDTDLEKISDLSIFTQHVPISKNEVSKI